MIISIAAQQGGTGKSTTASCLAYAAARNKRKVLLIDFDSQGTVSFYCGADRKQKGSYELLSGASASDLIQNTGEIDIIPSSINLAGADIEFSMKPGKDFFLKEALEPIKNHYDLIIIDNAPALGTLLVNSITASDEIIIPERADAAALPSIFQIMETISMIKKYTNKNIGVPKVLITQYDNRTVLSRDIAEAISTQAEKHSFQVLNTKIRKCIATQEAQMLNQNIYEYAPKCNTALDYMELFKELKL